MPKQVNFVPNERVDLDDLTYGTSTFTVDELKSHVQRLVSGDHHGGFVLEGFRVEITDGANRKITVHNGIALDRDGRLVTFEDGDNFSRNIDIKKGYTLTTFAGPHYVMVEFAFDDTDDDTRAVWDPTYENPNIIDSAGNTHAAPNGKESPLNIPTRRAISWRIITNTTGFPDWADLGTDGHTLLIPIAIIPVTGFGAIDVVALTLEVPWTTIISTPETSDTILACANTRLFTETGRLEILNRLGSIVVVSTSSSAYSHNDDDNNVIAGIAQNGTSTLFADVKAGDIVVLADDFSGATATTATYLAAGSKDDARPLLFSFTDPVADSEEVSGLERDPRNQRYAAAIALLRKYIPAGTPIPFVDYPSTAAAFYKLQLPEEPDRVEFNLKQGQDLLRSLGALVREMKYGSPLDLYNLPHPSGPEVVNLSAIIGVTNNTTKFAFFVSTYHPEFHSGLTPLAIGSTLTFSANTVTPGLIGVSRTITDISAIVHNGPLLPNIVYYVVTLDAALPAIPAAAAEMFSITKDIDLNTQFVSNYNIGNLNEVYRARIDRITNTWTGDLQERLAANKMPVVTIGDGMNTFGDYNGNAGLVQAFTDVFNAQLGGIIYVKRGSYTLNEPVDMGSNTILMGEGPDSTTITYATETDSISLDSITLVPQSISNIQIKDISLIAADITSDPNVTGKSSVITLENPFGWNLTNFVIDNCYMRGGSFYSAGPDIEKGQSSLLNFRVIPAGGILNANDRIKILNSRFFIEGSGLYFQDVRNVQIDNCIFETEVNTLAASFIGCVEGIVFDSGRFIAGLGGAAYGSTATPELIEGEVSVSNCEFRGRHTVATNLPPRGWIFFSPSFSGQNSSVTDCQFIGDTVGDLGPLIPPFKNAAVSGSGVGIVDVSSEDVFINGCLFHSYNEGIRAAQGKTIINNCSFWGCANGVLIGSTLLWPPNFDYSTVDINWTFYAWINFVTEVRGSSFGGNLGGTGIGILPQTNFNNASITIKTCEFNDIENAIDYQSVSDYSLTQATVPTYNYNVLEVNSCSFISVRRACVQGGMATNVVAALPTVRHWAIAEFIYKNNTHMGVATDNVGFNVVNISGKDTYVENNTVTSVSLTLNPEIIFNVLAPDTLIFNNNTFTDCQTLVNSAVIKLTHLSIDLMSSTPDLCINNNTIKTPGSGIGIHDGIIVKSSIEIDNSITSNLTMKGNDFYLENANYVFLASQDQSVPTILRRKFLWTDVTISNNVIRNTIDAVAAANFSLFSNDALYDSPAVIYAGFPIQYLGGAAATTYCGIIDLRLFADVGLWPPPTQCNISGNQLSVGGDALSGGTFSVPGASKDVQELVGIRITHWPRHINISDNTMVHAPLILNNNWWNVRNDAAHSPRASIIKVNNNTIINPDIGTTFSCLVDITPACGVLLFGGGPFPTDRPYHQTELSMTNNIIQTDNGQVGVGAYIDLRNVVRLGQLLGVNAIPSVPATPNDEIDTINLQFKWQISDNQFNGMPIIVDSNGLVGGALGPHLDNLTVTIDGAWGGAAVLPVGVRLIVVENNQFTSGTGEFFQVGHIFGTTRRLGVARLYIGNLDSTTATSTAAGSIARILFTDIEVYPDTTGTLVSAPVTAGHFIQSDLIVQNNSGTLGAQRAFHAFTGSLINQG